MDGLDVGQLNILVKVKGEGSVLLWVQVEVNAGSILLCSIYSSSTIKKWLVRGLLNQKRNILITIM
jgi:hypothetical protein